MKILGQLEGASLEQLVSDPATNIQGHIFTNTTDGKTKIDNGTAKRAIIQNDERAVFGTDVTAANNVRVHKGGAGVIQDVLGNDVTVDGVNATSLAQRSSRVENYTDGTKPAVGNPGRLVWLTDLAEMKVDNGASYQPLQTLDQLTPGTTKGDLIVRNSSASVRLPAGSDGQFLRANSAVTLGLEYASPSGISAYRSVTTTDAVGVNDGTLDLSGGSFTSTLPTAIGVAGKQYKFIHNGTSLTQIYGIATTSAQVLKIPGTGGFTSLNMYTNGEVFIFESDGVGWNCISHYCSNVWTNSGANVISAVTTPPVQTGNTKTVDKLWWRRVGCNAEIRIEFDQTNAGTNTAGTGNYLFTIPSGLTIDTAALTVFGGATINTNNTIKTTNSVGSCFFSTTTGGFQFSGGVLVYDSTHVRLGAPGGSTNGADPQLQVVGSTETPLTSASINYNAVFSVPISGWQP